MPEKDLAMPVYAYCLLRTPSQQEWPVLQGIGGHPVFPSHCGRYTMLLSLLKKDFSFTPRSIVEHGQIVAHTFETHTVLPMRFGTVFPSEKHVENLIKENQRELLETFSRLRGKAEMRLKFQISSGNEAKGPAKKSPQKTLSLKKALTSSAPPAVDPKTHALAEKCVYWLREAFRPLQDTFSCRNLPGDDVAVDCAHLIEACRIEDYRKATSSLASAEMSDGSLRLSGPWPPYHFLPNSIRMPAPVVRASRPKYLAIAAQ